MSERVVRAFRKQANEAARQHVQAITPNVEAALRNEQITRQRVEALEQRVSALGAEFHAISEMNWPERLKFLFGVRSIDRKPLAREK